MEHLPWRALSYKAMNTFVDDISAFLIDMPWLHRLSCLRDDVIFLAYLYQRWIYRVDKTRVTRYTIRDETGDDEIENAEEIMGRNREGGANEGDNGGEGVRRVVDGSGKNEEGGENEESRRVLVDGGNEDSSAPKNSKKTQ